MGPESGQVPSSAGLEVGAPIVDGIDNSKCPPGTSFVERDASRRDQEDLRWFGVKYQNKQRIHDGDNGYALVHQLLIWVLERHKP